MQPAKIVPENHQELLVSNMIEGTECLLLLLFRILDIISWFYILYLLLEPVF